MDIRRRLKKLYSFRQTLWDMSLRSLKTKYSGSFLGLWWAVITPCILALSINFIFTRVFRAGEHNFTFFILSGIVPWIFFSNTVSEVCHSFTSNASLLKQCIFPREIIPISFVIANFLNFLIGFLFLLPLFIIAEVEVIKVMPMLLLVLVSYFIFVLGLSMLFASLNVFFRDIGHFLPTALMTWFWITPLFYRLEMLDFPYRWICLLNPMTYYALSYQSILFKAEAPSIYVLGISFLIGLLFLIIGYYFFLKKESELLKRI